MSTVINSVGNALTGQTGTGAFVGATSPTITTPIIQQINDTNGKGILLFGTEASAVNFIEITNSATGTALGIEATGTDTNIIVSATGKGTGGFQIGGTTAADNASAGFVGEEKQTVVASGSAVSLSNNTAHDVATLALTDGDWDVYGNIFFSASIGFTAIQVWMSLTSATAPDTSLLNGLNGITGSYAGVNAPFLRVNISSPSTVYLSGLASFASGTCTGCGGIYARRRR